VEHRGQDRTEKGVCGGRQGCIAASEVFTADIEDGQQAEPEPQRPPVAMPKETPPGQPDSTPPPESTGAKITEPQRRRLFALASKANVTQEDLRLHLRGMGIEHTESIPKALYDGICSWLRAGPTGAGTGRREGITRVCHVHGA